MRMLKTPPTPEIAYQARPPGRPARRAYDSRLSNGAVGGSKKREMASGGGAAMISAGSDLPGPGVLSPASEVHLHGG